VGDDLQDAKPAGVSSILIGSIVGGIGLIAAVVVGVGIYRKNQQIKEYNIKLKRVKRLAVLLKK